MSLCPCYRQLWVYTAVNVELSIFWVYKNNPVMQFMGSNGGSVFRSCWDMLGGFVGKT